MKNKKGITLISLVITIIVILILAGVGISGSLSLIEYAEYVAAINERKQVDEAVAILIAEKQLESAETGEPIVLFTEVLDEKAISELPETLRNEIKYIRAKLAGTDVSAKSTSDFTTTKLETGDGKNLYYIDSSLTGGKEKVYIYDEQSASAYRIEPTIIWGVEMHGYEYGNLLVSQSGLLKKAQGKKEEILKDGSWSGVANAPKLEGTGLIPVYFGENGKTIELTEESSKEEWANWYDYSESEKRWANAVTKDSSGKITGYFVWIPRYAYKITSGLYTNTTGTIEVKFLKGTSNLDSGDREISNTYPTVTGDAMDDFVVHPAFEDGSENGKNNNYMNGEWDEEIEGFWVSKYSAGFQKNTITDNNGTLSTAISNSTDSVIYSNKNYTAYWATDASTNALGQTLSSKPKMSYPVFKPLTYTYNGISIGDCYTLSQEIKNGTSFYNLSNIDSHLLKNSEYGAVTYLTLSNLGIGKAPNVNNYYTSEASPYKVSVTGIYANSAKVEKTTTLGNAYYSQIGVQGSSTGNITGVYDLSGCNINLVPIYITNGNKDGDFTNYAQSFTSSHTAVNPNGYKTLSTKYATVYPYDSSNDTAAGNKVKYESLKTNTYGYGDALIEISKPGSTSGWNECYISIPFDTVSFIARNGGYRYSKGGGINTTWNTSGLPHYSVGFRVTLIPDKQD